jgi:hypothetical protein
MPLTPLVLNADDFADLFKDPKYMIAAMAAVERAFVADQQRKVRVGSFADVTPDGSLRFNLVGGHGKLDSVLALGAGGGVNSRFILLFDAFGVFRSALLILLNIPFALIGGIFALLITGIPLSVSAAIGFIALFGQAVLNGVVMVAYFNQLRAAGASPEEAVMRGSLTRMRTVLMTGLLAALGLLPMAVSTGIGSETQKPLAVVVIGGLVTATLLTLIVLPALYLVFERLAGRRWRPTQEGR